MYRKYPKPTAPRCNNCRRDNAPYQRIFTVEEGGEWVWLCRTCNDIYVDYYHDHDAARRDARLKAERDYMGRLHGAVSFRLGDAPLDEARLDGEE